MHPIIFRRFHEICADRGAGGAFWEIGATPSDDSLLCLPCLHGATEKIGINLDGPHRWGDFTILQGDANAMTCFPDGRFDTILCNSTLEHDKYFWMTLAEIRRVARKGALVVLGVPGYANLGHNHWVERLSRVPLLKRLLGDCLSSRLASTPTLQVHDFPGDYYRFSPQAMAKVFFQGCEEVQIECLMRPPRILGSGFKT